MHASGLQPQSKPITLIFLPWPALAAESLAEIALLVCRTVTNSPSSLPGRVISEELNLVTS